MLATVNSRDMGASINSRVTMNSIVGGAGAIGDTKQSKAEEHSDMLTFLTQPGEKTVLGDHDD